MCPESDLPVVSSSAESFFSDDAGPDVEALLTVSVELQLLSSLHLLPVLRQDQKGVCRHRVQRHVLWNQQDTTRGEVSRESDAPLRLKGSAHTTKLNCHWGGGKFVQRVGTCCMVAYLGHLRLPGSPLQGQTELNCQTQTLEYELTS